MKNKNPNSKIQTLKSISKFQNQKSKFHSGITLIALVVTIVILLILASITITLVFGDNDIFNLTKQAADKTNSEIEKTLGEIDELNNWLIEENSKGPNGKRLVSAIKKDDSKNQEAEDKNGKPITIPAGFTVLEHGTDGVEYNHEKDHSPTVEDGIVVQDSVGNQFVWVPVDDAAYAKMINETNHRGNLYDFGSYDSTTQTWTPYTSPQLKGYSATGNREPDVVTGVRGTTGTSYDGDANNYTSAGIVDKGKKPITTAPAFQTQLQWEFNQMVASVKEHKGFYIGRYETGNLEAVKNSIPVVQRGNTNINNVNWYYMYANSKNIAKNDKYISSMIWGCQWDRALDWLVATNGGNYSLVTDSSSWGNYKDQEFDYTVKNGTETTTVTKHKDTGTKIPTGSTERNKKNNIYDMAGNVYAWTIEAGDTYGRVLRRGQ